LGDHLKQLKGSLYGSYADGKFITLFDKQGKKVISGEIVGVENTDNKITIRLATINAGLCGEFKDKIITYNVSAKSAEPDADKYTLQELIKVTDNTNPYASRKTCIPEDCKK
jgi:hypothetical protein